VCVPCPSPDSGIVWNEVYAVIAALVQPLTVVRCPVLTVFVVVNEVQSTGLNLEGPYCCRVVHSQIPRRMHGHVLRDIDLTDTALALASDQLCGVVRAGDD
jgi:hypothetical protein